MLAILLVPLTLRLCDLMYIQSLNLWAKKKKFLSLMSGVCQNIARQTRLDIQKGLIVDVTQVNSFGLTRQEDKDHARSDRCTRRPQINRGIQDTWFKKENMKQEVNMHKNEEQCKYTLIFGRVNSFAALSGFTDDSTHAGFFE